jgi:hypothetical protein
VQQSAFIIHAKKNPLPVRDRLIFFKDEQEFLPGITDAKQVAD